MKNNSIITQLKEISTGNSYKKIDGVVVDIQTANLILNVYDGLREELKKDYISRGILRMADIAWKLVAKQQARGQQ